ncbi:hypothetical protein C8R43DRAFT_514265, partial [Mycena crocata]
MFKKRSSSSSSSSSSSDPLGSHPGLKPLHLVQELLASKVIQPLPSPQESAPFLGILKRKSRMSVQIVPATSSAGSHVSISQRVSRAPRSCLAGQSATLQKRAPFVVPLHFSVPPPAHVASCSALTQKQEAPKPIKRRVSHVVNPLEAVPRPSNPVGSSKAVIPPPLKSQERVKSVKRRISRAVPPPASAESGPRASNVSDCSRAIVSPPSQPREEVKPVKPVKRRASRAVPPPASVKSVPRVSDPFKRRKSTLLRSRIPVFVGSRSAGIFSPAPTPWFGSSRIPRLRYSRSPSATPSDSASIMSYDLLTPCPSPLLETDGRQLARRVVLETTKIPATNDLAPCADEVEVKLEASDDANIAPSANVVSPISIVQLTPPALKGASDPDPAVPSVINEAVEPALANDQTDATGVLGELKIRLGNNKDLSTVRPSHSPSKDTLVIVKRPACEPSGKENAEQECELQKAFARRRSAIFGPSCTSDDKTTFPQVPLIRRPLALVPHRVNQAAGTEHGPLPIATQPPPQSHAPCTPSASSPRPSPANSNPPGADFDTELVTTAFGTRKVRKLVIPPMLEGSLPSRDPRINMELDRLRAQQKVGVLGSAAPQSVLK